MTLTKAQKTEQTEAIEHLREMLKPGDELRTILRHRSQSGMSRSISVIHIGTDGSTFDISWLVSRVVESPIDQRNDGVKRGGCGMDMGFDLVYSLSRHLFRDGFDCIGEAARCPANDHSNDRERNYSPTRHHNDGGYALRQRWL